MSTQLETVDLQIPNSDDNTASGTWSTTVDSRSDRLVSPRFIGTAATALLAALASSSALAGFSATSFEDDLWIDNDKHSNATVSPNDFKSAIGRPISRAEALQVARSIRERAERERFAIADAEARRGIEWDD